VIGARGATGPAQIRITDVELSRSLVRPANGAVAGKVEIVAQRLYDRSSSKPIGRGQIVCTFVDRSNRTCVSSYLLPRGVLVVSGPVRSRLLYELPVVGGTGYYDNARGSVTITASHLHPRREVLVFRLTG